MENEQNLGRVVNVIEERPVHCSAAGDLIPGNVLSFVDLVLVNHRGNEKVVRLPVSDDVIQFYSE